MGLRPQKISYPAGDISVPGFLCLPKDQAACAAVIIFHGSDGFKPNHEMIARKLAKEGFAALALIMASLIPQTKAVVNYFGLTAWQGGLEALTFFLKK